jgi:CBS domain-containing protein
VTAVSEVIEHKGAMVLCVDQNEPVFDAISLMAEVNIGAVLVKQNDAIAGIFTERDYLQKVVLKSRSSHDTFVKEVMSSPVISASPEDTVEQCLETMSSCRCRHLPIVAGGELMGIVSIGDLVKQILDEKDNEIEQLNQYIAGSY